ncbi:sugar phosphate isomerase/epimerase [Salinibacterium sp. SYSU T00001]|uniref:sugar phosphate isomerase/epimerase family protein n=1 Tax=Homoserinimonas sedimenticola TaxID=2986805 RepID=UPI00223657B3|nr:sugar phosphate isomerase/epimerase [Salinibacterium sedimenticola]MCW4385486.1 sugar phosphate isomerase/epimerase [Salinibacterium sedimenticola]
MVNDDKPVQLGVAPLSAITTPPAEFIRAAHAAGFSSVGLRPMQVSETDAPFPLDLSSADFAGIKRALDETGLTVVDIEVLSVTPERTREEWLPMLDAGAALGARLVNIVCDDPSLSRFVETLSAITVDAHERGLEPVLEPVAYRPLNSFPRAVEIAREVGCAVELDALHYLRTGAELSTIADNADIIPILQLCDAPASIAEQADALRPLASDGSDTALAIAESRARRLLPGEGVVPLTALLDALSPEVAVSVEIPNVPLRGDSSASDYLAVLHRAAMEYLATHTRAPQRSGA